jgi:hypothetical protein
MATLGHEKSKPTDKTAARGANLPRALAHLRRRENMINLSAYNEEMEGYRIDRLLILYQLLRYRHLHTKIESLHDHKGCLEVGWTSVPYKSDLESIESIWGEFCECLVDHYLGETEIDTQSLQNTPICSPPGGPVLLPDQHLFTDANGPGEGE